MKELIEKLDCVRFQPYDGVVVYRDEAGKEETLWGVITETIDTIERLQAENENLFYTLEGVMHSVDKWLDDSDYSPNRVQRAATMREKTLQIVEQLQAELEQTKRERNAAVADINCGCICVVCKHEKYCKMAQNPLCDEEEPCRFEWRGVQEESE